MARTQLTDACAYYRMSSDDQTTSIAQQRREVEAYAQRHGYRIVCEYVDEGKSGSKEPEKRLEFQRMLMESSQGRWQAVLAWDSARFGRLDSIDGAFAKQILRRNNIYLDTCKEGKFDWREVEGRWKDMALQEAAAAYSRALSKDSLRGRQGALERQSWPHGAVPYGYHRCYIDTDGKQHVMPRIAHFRKPKHWRLVLTVNEVEAQVVRHIFHEFVTRDISFRRLANQLNAQGVVGPDWMEGRHKDWTKENVQRTLARACYVGVAQIGYARKTKKEVFNRAEKAQATGICPAVVDAQVWHDAQAKLEQLKGKHSNHHSRRSSALSGIVVCGNCGHRMVKRMKRRGKTCPTCYTCASASRGRLTGCHQWSVKEDDLLPVVWAKLEQVVDDEILRQLSAPGSNITDTDILEKQLEDAQAKVQRASRRYLTAPDDIQADLEDELRKLKEEVAQLEESLKIRRAMDHDGGVQAYKVWWEEVKQTIKVGWSGKTFVILWAKGAEPKPSVQPEKLRALLKKLGVSVTVFWRQTGKNKGRNSKSWEVDHARLRVDIAWEENTLGDHTSRPPQKVFFFQGEWDLCLAA